MNGNLLDGFNPLTQTIESVKTLAKFLGMKEDLPETIALANCARLTLSSKMDCFYMGQSFLVSTPRRVDMAKKASGNNRNYIKNVLYISVIALVLSMVSISSMIAASTADGQQGVSELNYGTQCIDGLKEKLRILDTSYSANPFDVDVYWQKKYVEELISLHEELKTLEVTISTDPKNITAWSKKVEILEGIAYKYGPSAQGIGDEKNATYYKEESEKCKLTYDSIEKEAKNVEYQKKLADDWDKDQVARAQENNIFKETIFAEIESCNKSIAENASDHSALYQRGQKYRELAQHVSYCDFESDADNETQKKQREACNKSVNESQGYVKAALDSFQFAIKAAGSSVPLSYRFSEGLAYRDLLDLDNALKCFDKVVALANSSPNSNDQIYYIWGLYAKAALLEFKDPNESIKCYMSILQKDAYDYRMWDRLSRIYKRQGMYTEATEAKAEAKSLKAEVKSLGTLPKLPEV